jgi:hypothetical protein
MAVCAVHQVPETFGVYECTGDSAAIKRANALISQPIPPVALGIVLDADGPNLIGRWRQVVKKLSHYEYVFPALPDKNGTIIVSENSRLPRLGIWLMPDNCVDGMLEDLCCEMISESALSAAISAVETASAAGVTTFKPPHLSKAILHTYLAWQDEPGQPIGKAISRQALIPHTPTSIRFTEWLRLLFV